jgi:hypothetical protein
MLKMTAFWDTAPCNLVDVDRRFRGTFCLHHRPDDEVRTSGTSVYFSEATGRYIRKAVILMLATVKT